VIIPAEAKRALRIAQFGATISSAFLMAIAIVSGTANDDWNWMVLVMIAVGLFGAATVWVSAAKITFAEQKQLPRN
jgi:hypothetical protein